MKFSTFGMAKCEHEKLGQLLAATIGAYANQREVSKLAGDLDYVEGWKDAITDVRAEMVTNVSDHFENCETI